MTRFFDIETERAIGMSVCLEPTRLRETYIQLRGVFFGLVRDNQRQSLELQQA